MYAWEHAFSNDEVADWINENRMRYERDGYGYWAVIHKMSERLIGVCGLLKEQADYENYVGLGYIFNKDYWGRGYALESASACVDYAFHTLKVKELTAQIRPNNLPEIFQDLNGRSNKQIHHIITKLDDQQCKELIDAMRTVKKHLSIATKNIIVRCFQNQDIEYVIDRQLSLYVSERQFTRQIWKKYLIEGVFKFYRAI